MQAPVKLFSKAGTYQSRASPPPELDKDGDSSWPLLTKQSCLYLLKQRN
jgi:hypothetical protein